MQPRAVLAVGAVALAVGGTASLSAGTLTYSYDAKGRLSTACDARPASGDLSRYRHDAADNRTSYSHARTDQTLSPGASITSPNGKFMFLMQYDGNLVAYGNFGAGWTPLGWATNTVGSGANVAAFQSDGNLVLYGPSGAIWSTGTWQYHCATLSVQDDSNVVIKDVGGNLIWQTGTGGH